MLLKNHLNLLIFKMENIGKKLSTEINNLHNIVINRKLSHFVNIFVNLLFIILLQIK